jgi:hypothetical protein
MREEVHDQDAPAWTHGPASCPMTLGRPSFQVVPLTSEPAPSIIAVAASLRKNQNYIPLDTIGTHVENNSLAKPP